MTGIARALVAAAVFTLFATGGYALDAQASNGEQAALGPGLVRVEIDIEHSVFSVDELHVRPGTTVEFVVRNGDPINHEFVTGDEAVHARHERGREARHPPIPGEVSVGPGEIGVTFYEFVDPGTFEFACHLPGHVAYGMVGQVVVAE